jgi:hypothetical protein
MFHDRDSVEAALESAKLHLILGFIYRRELLIAGIPER